jgi:hypothetical protein
MIIERFIKTSHSVLLSFAGRLVRPKYQRTSGYLSFSGVRVSYRKHSILDGSQNPHMWSWVPETRLRPSGHNTSLFMSYSIQQNRRETRPGDAVLWLQKPDFIVFGATVKQRALHIREM